MSEPITGAEREILEAAGCGWVLARLEVTQERASDWQRIAYDHAQHIARLEAIIARLHDFVRATAEDEGHLAPEAKALLREVF